MRIAWKDRMMSIQIYLDGWTTQENELRRVLFLKKNYAAFDCEKKVCGGKHDLLNNATRKSMD